MYCVIVGDIIQSKSLDPVKRYESTEIISQILNRINAKYADSILAGFGIVRGDAFEGVLFSLQYAPEIIQEIIKALYFENKVKVRISAVLDDLSVVSTNRDQADGRAFYIAMQSMEELRKRKSEHWFQVAMQTNSVAQPLVDSTLQLISALTEEWTDKQTEIIWNMLECSEQQSLVSKKLNISASVVNKQLKAAHYEAYRNAWGGLEQYLIDYEESLLKPQNIVPSYTTYYSIAERKHRLRDYESAIELFLKSIELAKEKLGEDSPNLAPLYNSLAAAYLGILSNENISDKKKRELQDKTGQILSMSLECQKLLPKMRFEFARTLDLYGSYFMRCGDYDKALEYYLEAMQIIEDRYGPENPMLASFNNNIAIVYHLKGKYDEALDYYYKDLKYAEQNREHDILDYADSLYNIGECYEDMKQNEKAMDYFNKALDILVSVLPAKHEYVIEVQEHIAKIS